MEILWITENFFPNKGGMAQSCDRIVAGLKKNGVIVHVLHFSNRHAEITYHSNSSGKYWAIPASENYPHTLQIAYQILKNQIPNIHGIVAFGGFLPILSVEIYSSWLQVPYIICIRGNDFDAAIFHYQRRQVLLQSLENAKQVICVSSDKSEKINLLCQKGHAIFVANGIEEEWRATDKEMQDCQVFRNQHSGKLIMGFFGQLKEKKGLLFFLKALKKSGIQEKFHLVLIGEMEQQVADFVEKEQISSTILPFTDRYELIQWYLNCHWIGLPSFYDGMPNVLLEAMSLGTPCFGSNVDGMKDVIEHQKDGWLFEDLNESDLIFQLHQIVSINPKDYELIGKNAKEKVLKYYSSSRETADFLKSLNFNFKS